MAPNLLSDAIQVMQEIGSSIHHCYPNVEHKSILLGPILELFNSSTSVNLYFFPLFFLFFDEAFEVPLTAWMTPALAGLSCFSLSFSLIPP